MFKVTINKRKELDFKNTKMYNYTLNIQRDDIVIGHIYFDEIDLKALEYSDYSFGSKMDQLTYLFNELFNSKTNRTKRAYDKPILIYIEKIFIQPEYRKQGATSYVLSNFRELLKDLNILNKDSIIFLKAFPLEQNIQFTSMFIKEQKRIIKIYRKCGFKKVKNDCLMYK